MKSSAYWQKRFELVEQAQNQLGVQCYAQIEQQYRMAQRQLEAQIRAWYQRFADNNGVTMQESRKMLTNRELAELKWDINQYIQYGEENAINGTWMKQLENASARYHISRLEALKLQTQQSIETLFGNQLDTIDIAMKSIYTSGYYHTAFEIQKGMGVAWDFATLDERAIQKIINRPWAADGKNFSSRIWENRQKLVNELNTELTRNIILGQDPQKVIDAIARKMGTSKSSAGRLVMTEEAFFSSAAQKDSFNELGVEQYRILATLDSHTSDICREMDGKVYPMKVYEPGVTAPPFHCWCRTTTVPHFGDEFDFVGQRAERGEDGKTYHVPASMTYPEWEKAMVDGDKSVLQSVKTDATMKTEKLKAEPLKPDNFPAVFNEKAEAKNTKALADYINGLEGADPDVIALYNSMGRLENIQSEGISFKVSHGKSSAVSITSYRMSGNLAEVQLTIPKLQGDNLVGQVNSTLHEEMHLMDLYGRKDVQKPGNWFSTGRQSLVDAFNSTSSDIGDDVKKLFADHNAEWKRVSSEIRDKYQTQINALNDSMLNRTFNGTYSEYKKQYSKLTSQLEDERNYACRNIMGGGIGNLQDIYDALSGGEARASGKVIYGHGRSYYSSMTNRVHETIANYAALSVTRPDLIDLLRADKPELVAELDATIKELLKKVGK